MKISLHRKSKKTVDTMAFTLLVIFILALAMVTKIYIDQKNSEKEVSTRKTKKIVGREYVPPTTKNIVDTKEVEEEKAEEITITTRTMYTTTDVNLRFGASTDSKIYKVIPINTELDVVNEFAMNGWKRVNYDEKELYIAERFLSETKTEKPIKSKGKTNTSNKTVSNENKQNDANSSCGNMIGTFKITHYAEDNITATGTTPTVGRTIAVDPRVIPYGSRVVINGHTYIAEDCGGAIKGNVIDIYVNSTEEAYQKGVYYTEVYWG